MSTINYYDVPPSELYRVPGIYHGAIECIFCSTTEEPQYANFNDYDAKDSRETSPGWKCKCKAVLVLDGDTGGAKWYTRAKEEEF